MEIGEGYDGTPLWADAQPENRLGLDPAGSGHLKLLAPHEDTGLSALNAMRALATLYPFDRSEIVWPAGWLCDADGRGLSVLEMQQYKQRLTKQEKAA